MQTTTTNDANDDMEETKTLYTRQMETTTGKNKQNSVGGNKTGKSTSPHGQARVGKQAGKSTI